MNSSNKPSLVQNLMVEEKGVPLPNETTLMYNYEGDEDLASFIANTDSEDDASSTTSTSVEVEEKYKKR